MEGHIHEWLNLLVRWIHVIVGIAWIGASFYFNWLENNLNRKAPQEDGIAGHLWAVHGGGFYYLKKFKHGPETLPDNLHWFKWEAYTTWLSGFTLLIIVYYFNAELFLINPSISNLTPAKAIILGITAIGISWFIYDLLCKSTLKQYPLFLGILIFTYFGLLSLLLSEVFSGRGAYLHVGAAIGTVMVANVFFVIIPAQKEMVSALKEKRPLDPIHGQNGLLRSRHNNYLTLPVLFIMVSSHFPSTYGHHWNWLILIAISLIGIAVRHYFNVRHTIKSLWWILPVSFVAITYLMWLTAPPVFDRGNGLDISTTTADIFPIIQSRCGSCHSTTPTQPGFSAPPQGLVFDTPRDIEINAQRIHNASVTTKTMPIGNLTKMTGEERQQVANWFISQSNDKTQ
ncbi:MAG: hypothetical protein GKR96_07025 [Gammaproteobacteria bacterium]|nr:hypothetical protein [Gammaproteobacteria bacterium]